MNKTVMRMAHAMAYLGGLTLLALILLTCFSILGRMLNGFLHFSVVQEAFPFYAQWLLDLGVGPINGDYELVEAGMAFAIFSFLPLCQLTAGHAVVDVFVGLMPAKMSRFLIWLSEVIFALVLILIAYQLQNGLQDKFGSNETTFLLQFPIWWSYALSLFGAVMAALAAVYMAWLRTLELITSGVIVVEGEGAGH